MIAMSVIFNGFSDGQTVYSVCGIFFNGFSDGQTVRKLWHVLWLYWWSDSLQCLWHLLCFFSDPRNMVAFGVVTDVRLASVLGMNSSVTAMMLRPFNTTLVQLWPVFRSFLMCVSHTAHIIDIGWTSVCLSVRHTLVLCQNGSAYRQTVFTAW